MAEPQDTHGWRFSLRTLLIAMALTGLAAINWKFLLYFGVAGQKDALFWPTLIGLTALTWNLGQSGPGFLAPHRQPNKAIAIAWLCLLTVGTLWFLWIRYRWQILAFNPPQPSPFPDRALLAYHGWLDKRNPAPPGSIKFHGEVYLVYITLNYAAWLAAAILAFNVGLLLRVNRRAMIGRVRNFVAHLLERNWSKR